MPEELQDKRVGVKVESQLESLRACLGEVAGEVDVEGYRSRAKIDGL